jgi:polysaccharide export outer membrane protein
MYRTIQRVSVSIGAAAVAIALTATTSAAQASKPTQSATSKPNGQPETPKPGAPSAAAVPVPSDYLIGPSDILTILFYAQDPMLSGDAIVGPDGRISRLMINEIQVGGLTLEQLRVKLTEAYAKFFDDPTIVVLPKQINSRKVFITGMVLKPGSYDLLEPMNLLQLLTLAGGLQEFADKEHIVLVRKQPLQNGKPDITEFNYNNLFDPKKLDKIPQLKPGDQVVVR